MGRGANLDADDELEHCKNLERGFPLYKVKRGLWACDWSPEGWRSRGEAMARRCHGETRQWRDESLTIRTDLHRRFSKMAGTRVTDVLAMREVQEWIYEGARPGACHRAWLLQQEVWPNKASDAADMTSRAVSSVILQIWELEEELHRKNWFK